MHVIDMLANNLELDSKIKVAFNSISFSDFPADQASVTVVSSEGKTGGLSGVDESIARGEVIQWTGSGILCNTGPLGSL